MIAGLAERDLNIICSVIEAFPEVEQALIFGSGAKGNFKRGSDIDIVLKGLNVKQIAWQIHDRLERETPLPYFFDVVDNCESGTYRTY